MKFEFIADQPVLDFVATVSERGTTNLEMLEGPADLEAWVQQSGIIDDDLTLTDSAFQQAIAVREALFCCIAGLINETPLGDSDRQVINSAAAQPGPYVEVDADGRVRRGGDLSAVLAELSRQVLNLYRSPDREHLRWCDDPRCTRPFIDRSRAQQRRWCGMQGCGDRAKAAAYRRRRRTAGTVAESRR